MGIELLPQKNFDAEIGGKYSTHKMSIQLNSDAFESGKDEKDLQDFVACAIREHERLLATGGETVRKNAAESAVTIVILPGFSAVCVKQFRWRGSVHALKGLFRATQGIRAYRNGIRLNNLGIRTPIPLALARATKRGLATSEWIVMEVIPEALELDRYLLMKKAHGWTFAEKRRSIRAFGRFIGSIHASGIFHSDLKTCNIVVSEQVPGSTGSPGLNLLDDPDCHHAVSFALLDYDDVKFAGTISKKRRIKNLVQLFLSTPILISAADRMLFLREYGLHAGLTGLQRRTLARQVLEAVLGKEILYVGFHGDIVECWDRSPLLGEAQRDY